MIENHLTAALRKLVARAVKDFSLPAKSGNATSPRIVNGYLPPEHSDTEDDFPFVLIRPEQGTSEGGQTSVTVSLTIGCFSGEYDGYEYCLEVMTRIRQALATLKDQTLDRKYQLQFPITWENIPDQSCPKWQIDMSTRWTFNTPQLTDF